MRIMLTDRSETGAHLARSLRADGHEVTEACLPDRTQQHGCQGMGRGTCPLDAGVDLAVSTLERDQAVAAAGTVCARRAGVPIVALGRHDAYHPDLDRSLRRTAARGDELVRWSLREALGAGLAALGVSTVGASVSLERRPDGERIVVDVPAPLTARQRGTLAVRLLAAVTATGREGRRRDVSIRSV